MPNNRYPEIAARVGAIRDIWTITPDDDTDLPVVARAIYVGTSGAVAYLPPGADTTPRTLPNLAAGVFHHIEARRILATGTTAADIRGGD